MLKIKYIGVNELEYLERKKILNSIQDDEVVNLTRELVMIPSTTGEEKKVAEHLSNYFAANGILVYLEEVEKNRPNVIARLKGKGKGPTILFNGHMDTVPPGEGWTENPYGGLINNGFLYGRGATDMKGGLAVAAVAMKSLKDSGKEFCGEVIFSGVVGEEDVQLGTRHLVDSGLRADYAIVTEPTNLQIVNCHKGAVNLDVLVEGKGAHASTPEQGLNAIYHASRIALALEEYAKGLAKKKHEILGSPTLVVGTIEGGQVPYMVADHCKMSLDYRVIPGEDSDYVLNEIQNIVEFHNKKFPEFKSKTIVTYATPPLETDINCPVIKSLQKNADAEMGLKTKVLGWPGVSDGNILQAIGGIPTVLFGPGDLGKMAHQPNEGVAVNQLQSAVKILTLTLLDLLEF